MVLPAILGKRQILPAARRQMRIGVLLALALLSGQAFGQSTDCLTDEPLVAVLDGNPLVDVGQTETHFYDGGVPIGIIQSPDNVLFTAATGAVVLQQPDTLDSIRWQPFSYSYVTALSEYLEDDDQPSLVVAEQGLLSRYGYNSYFGDYLWAQDFRRASCFQDSIGDIAIQKSAFSTQEFFDQFGGADLIYIGTDYGPYGTCTGYNTKNRVIALNAKTGSYLWSFNEYGIYAVDDVSGLAVDNVLDVRYAGYGFYGIDELLMDGYQDRLFVTTERHNPSQDSVWALNVLNGSVEWSVDAGRILTKPVVRGDRLYVANLAGEVKALSRLDGGELWSLAHFIPFIKDFTVGRNARYDKLIVLVDYFGDILLVRDNGKSAKLIWTASLDPEGTVRATTAPVIDDMNGYVFVGASDGKIYQLDIKNGAVGPARTVTGAGGEVVDLLRQTPRKDASGAYVYTLAAVGENGPVARYCAPFGVVKGHKGKGRK